MRTIAIVVVALHVILLLSPPMQLTDMFNYLGYARLGALHHLNPYTHVIKQELFDPVYRFTSWHNLRSPYGPLFTALTYPLAFVSLPIAYWTLKVATVALSLGFVALVWQCARQLGRDPRFAVAFVAFNPIFLLYAVAGFHNDFFMLAPMLGAIALLLARRDRSAGAVLMLAVAVKFTAVLLLPFLLLGAAHPGRARSGCWSARRGGDPAGRAQRWRCSACRSPTCPAELAADRLQHPQRGRPAARDRRRHAAAAAGRHRRRGARRGATSSTAGATGSPAPAGRRWR